MRSKEEIELALAGFEAVIKENVLNKHEIQGARICADYTRWILGLPNDFQMFFENIDPMIQEQKRRDEGDNFAA